MLVAAAKTVVGSFGVVVLSPLLDQDSMFFEAVKDFSVQKFIAELTVEGLAVPFYHRLPGSMYSVLAPTFGNQSLMIFAVISGPLSDQIYFGYPYAPSRQ